MDPGPDRNGPPPVGSGGGPPLREVTRGGEETLAGHAGRSPAPHCPSGEDGRMRSDRFAVILIENGAQILGRTLEKPQDAGIAIIVEDVVRIGRCL